MSTDDVPRRIPLDIRIESGSMKATEPTDPFVGTAVGLSTPGHDGLAAMGRAFVEEFALMGWSRERLERMFRTPRYVAAHAVYQQRGPEFVRSLINDVLGPAQLPENPKVG